MFAGLSSLRELLAETGLEEREWNRQDFTS
jgi:hypothetical protein